MRANIQLSKQQEFDSGQARRGKHSDTGSLWAVHTGSLTAATRQTQAAQWGPVSWMFMPMPKQKNK